MSNMLIICLPPIWVVLLFIMRLLIDIKDELEKINKNLKTENKKEKS